MTRLCTALFASAFLLGACQDAPSSSPPPGASTLRSTSSARIGVPLQGADLHDYARVSKVAEEAAMQRSWRKADRDLQRLFAEHADRRYAPHLVFFASNRILNTHFAKPSLTPEEAEAAGRYAARMLDFEEVRSSALNTTLAALKPHWSDERFEVAAARLLTSADAPLDCFDCRSDENRERHAALQQHYRASVDALKTAQN